jgi:hypothetical protein
VAAVATTMSLSECSTDDPCDTSFSIFDYYPDVAIGVPIPRIQQVLADRYETLPRRVKVNDGTRNWRSFDVWTADADGVRTGVTTIDAIRAPDGGWLLTPLESVCEED